MVEPIAIIGSGCRFPGGADTPSKFWELIHRPRELSRKPSASRFDIDTFYHPVGAHGGTTNATHAYWLEDSERSNVAQFDAGFFNIQPGEVDAMDPQQRLLLEVVYDGLCAAGQPMDKLRGSDTAVYVGMMCDDYNTMMLRDWETLPRYTATGVERGIVANRVSYFFDWHGPSMTIDTACSSSLVALDQAVQVLRSGKSKMAVAAGTSLILSPAMTISESNLGMLSPSGRCAMWDEQADGYTRGEGVAAVVIKTLSQALADNDPIECIIRETAVNQDGRSQGLTMPSSLAQANLIRECYERAGLDPLNNPRDRPQFFHAHGTGTQAGDPKEAEAISKSLFPMGVAKKALETKLLVGSIKTVIGHTEGTAGLASLIHTSLAIRHGIVPPNLHFSTLNPKIAPFFEHLEIPTAAVEWPLRKGEIRRASVNSFGFGGTNAHCILEQYIPKAEVAQCFPAKLVSTPNMLFTPLVFSANSEMALRTMLSQYLDYLKHKPIMNSEYADLAYTLQHRHSTLAYRKAIVAPTIQEGIQVLENIILPASDSNKKDDSELGVRFDMPSRLAKVLGIFTGQGAQWPRMGAQLLESSPFAISRIGDLDEALQSLTKVSDRPSWTLKQQLLMDESTSRVSEAEFSQPLCTAVQIILVDILREAGISFAAVLGHSSGEIGAAYAAGFISAQDAIRIAYFRGVHAKLASSPAPHAPRGAMMAIGTSVEDARSFCDSEKFAGRIQVAAVNSSSSITLSGDEDAINEAEQIFKARGTFARKLKVAVAYHSAHMEPCARPYLVSLQECGVRSIPPRKDTTTTWYSSVYRGEPMNMSRLTNQYWVDNMCGSVLFADALAQAVQHVDGTFDLAIEVGPHPALKGPAIATLDPEGTRSIPYTGLLSRGQSDIEQLSAAMGFIWTRLGSDSVQFAAMQSLLSGVSKSIPKVVSDLPPYPFEHQRTYWTNSRLANHYKHRRAIHVSNPVLGSPCSEATTPGEFQWRNILQPSQIDWLKGHMLQGQMVFPATGYVTMAVEAIKILAFDMSSNSDAVQISILKLTNIEIPRALAFDDDNTSVETIFSVSSIELNSEKTVITAEWVCYSVADGSSGNIVLNAKGQVICHLSSPKSDVFPLSKGGEKPFNLVDIEDNHFYNNLSNIGYNYSVPFRGISNIRRKLDYSVGTLFDQSGAVYGDDNLVVHPGMLDSAIQTIFAAWSYPGDTNLRSLHVPVSISTITINPYFTPLGEGGKQRTMQYETLIWSKRHSKIVGDVYLHTEHESGAYAVVQFEGVTLVPFSPATQKNDLPMFSHFTYQVASPDGQLAAAGEEELSNYTIQLYKDIDRVAYWFVRNTSIAIPAEERNDLLPHFQHYLKWCDLMVDTVSQGADPMAKVSAKCNADLRQDIDEILAKYKDRKDVCFVEVVGDHLIPAIRSGTSMLEYMKQDSLLSAFYEGDSIYTGPTSQWLARLMSQISFRFPASNILEIGARTGASTSAILDSLGGAYASYTFTENSGDLVQEAEDRFLKEDANHRMIFKTLNMEEEVSGQGFVEASYDVIVAANTLHVPADIEKTISNVRRLLKPGGFLVVGEVTSNELLFTGMTIGTLPDWWIGVEAGRLSGPLLTLSQWDNVLKKTGFAGIDTVTPDITASLPISVFVTQAINDQVMLLRDPLAVKVHPVGVRTDALAIIGGTTLPVRKLGQKAFDLISSRFQTKESFDTLDDFANSQMKGQKGVTVLSLTDLDGPYLEKLTDEKFDALKILFATAETLIWVTCGSRADNPYSYMMTGLTNTIKTEYPNLNVQMFDLDFSAGIQPNTASTLAETILRQLVLYSPAAIDDNLLWTAEPQVFLDSNGQQLITRLLPDLEKNKRYNSQQRDIFSTIDPANPKEKLQLVADTRGQKDRTLELQKVSPLRLATIAGSQYRTVRVTYSLLQSLAVVAGGFLRLCVGVDIDTSEVVLALTSSNESPANIPTQWSIPFDPKNTPVASILVILAANLIADHILALTPERTTLLVNEPDSALQFALQTKANKKNVNIIFTTAKLRHEKDDSAVFLHANFPHHVIQSIVPTSTSVFVHFSRGADSDAVGAAIAESLPPACLRITEESLISHEAGITYEEELTTSLAQTLQKAWDAGTCDGEFRNYGVKCVSLGDVYRHTAIGEPLAVVEWTATEGVMVKVQPIDSGTLFRSDKTYVFLGMAGELGQSLAKWMMAHGARYVILTSRTPKVNPIFVDEMKEQYGGTIVSMSVDVTSRESLSNNFDVIKASLPPVAGIVNGAMILDDALFADMTLESFSRVTKPKVLGTQLLDELFYNDTSLDFFIVCSSISTVIGWAGQGNYSAANDYMTSLVRQRRKRGVAGAAINIPAVLGVGYAAQSDNFDFDYFQSLGYINISEEDLHNLFAEAVVSGRPDSDDQTAQVAMGVSFTPADLVVKQAHSRDVKLSHFVSHKDNDSATHGGANGSKVRVKVQLQTAKSPADIYTIVRDAFLAHLKRMLRIGEEEIVADSSTLDEQGVDSLVGVDIRSWFLKELEVDLPTLRILGGGSIADLVQAAIEKLPTDLQDGDDAGKGGSVSITKLVEDILHSEKVSTSDSSPMSPGSPVFTSASSSDSGIESSPASHTSK